MWLGYCGHVTTRKYASAVRDRQARQTRQEIIGAASRLFAERGYAQTSVAEIAAAAGVAVNTVYSSVGGKPDLIRVIVELSTTDHNISNSLDRTADSTDPREVLALLGRGTAEVNRRQWEGLNILLDNQFADPLADELAAQALDLYRKRLHAVADHLRSLDGVNPELSRPVVAEIVEFYFGPAAWRSVRALGWGWERAARWLADQAAHALLT